MYNDDEARREWEETIKRKTEQVRKRWASQFNGSVSLEDALVGVFAAASVKREIPRLLVKDSDGATDKGLVSVFDKIVAVMRTSTYHTINYTNRAAVELATNLCLKDSITGGDHPERDASYVLWGLVGERSLIYWDQGRDYPQYASRILEDLELQFGKERICLALREHQEFSAILGESMRIADYWENRRDLEMGTKSMDAKSRIELGFTKLADFIPEQSADDVDSFCDAVHSLVATEARKRLPYRRVQYQLRGIPITLGQNVHPR